MTCEAARTYFVYLLRRFKCRHANDNGARWPCIRNVSLPKQISRSARLVYTMRTKSIHTRKFFIKNVLFVENKH